ncbi:MAG: glycosyltransferase family 4 protein [Rectinema sp.]
MKVLFVINDAHGWAGTERVTNLIANGLSARLEVEVLSLRPRPQNACGYPYNPEVQLSYLPLAGGIRTFLASNVRVFRFTEQASPDVIILSGVGEIKNFIKVASPRRRHRPRLVAWEHFNAAYASRHLSRRIAARYCDVIVSLTKKDAEDWRQMLRPRAVVSIPNPVPEFPERAASLDTNRILALGRLEDQKRFDLLIDAFALFAQSHPGWYLRIRGSGSKEAELRDKICVLGLQDKMEIFPPTHDVAEEYAGASMYVLSSGYEGFPMTLVEAMAAGVPCVSFDCPDGPSEIIENDHDGFVVPLYDVVALAEKMGRLADDVTLRRQMGAAARQNIRRYEAGPILEQWSALLHGLGAGE